MNIKVAIVEDDEEIRRWLGSVVDESAELECSGVYPNASEFLSALPTLKPDVVLMDIHMPGMNGVECVSKAKEISPGSQYIMCTVFEDSDNIFNSLCAGATGYILKNMQPDLMLQAIKEAAGGGSPMSANIARKVVTSFHHQKPQSSAAAQLSTREKEILEYLSKGFRYKEIADKLFISTETVRTHIRNIYEKLQVQSRTEAINKVYFR
jgi:DNA-binding NarL/FixJ family response regulator